MKLRVAFWHACVGDLIVQAWPLPDGRVSWELMGPPYQDGGYSIAPHVASGTSDTVEVAERAVENAVTALRVQEQGKAKETT